MNHEMQIRLGIASIYALMSSTGSGVSENRLEAASRKINEAVKILDGTSPISASVNEREKVHV